MNPKLVIYALIAAKNLYNHAEEKYFPKQIDQKKQMEDLEKQKQEIEKKQEEERRRSEINKNIEEVINKANKDRFYLPWYVLILIFSTLIVIFKFLFPPGDFEKAMRPNPLEPMNFWLNGIGLFIVYKIIRRMFRGGIR